MSDHPRLAQVLRGLRSSRLKPACFKRMWDAGCCAVCVGRLCGVSAGLSVPQNVWEAALNRFFETKLGGGGGSGEADASAPAVSTDATGAGGTGAQPLHSSEDAVPVAPSPALTPHPPGSVCPVCCGLLQDAATVHTGDAPTLRFPRAPAAPTRHDKRQRVGGGPEEGAEAASAPAEAVTGEPGAAGGCAGAGDGTAVGSTAVGRTVAAAPAEIHWEGVDLTTLAFPRSTVAIVAYIRDKGYEGIVDYTLAVQMPQFMQLREFLMRCAISEEMGMKMVDLDRSVPTVELRRFLRCGLSESLTPVLGGVPYADSAEDADVAMTIACIHPDADFNLREFLMETVPRAQHHRTKQLPSMERILAPYGNTVGYPDAVSAKFRSLAPLTAPASYMVSVLRRPVYLSGRYLKLARGLSQTKWLIGGVQKGLGSVEELIGPVAAKHFKCAQTVFHSAGREDSDVRMLGSGRPFVVELVNSFVRPDDLDATAEIIQREVNEGSDLIEINSLVPTTKEHFVALQNGADSKRKKYICVVWVSKVLTPADLSMLNGLMDITVKQDTPIRVAHRRSMMTRTKYIHEVCAAPINAHFMHLTLTTSAGTYVKEFVHGDLGRTTPSVGSLLGCDADILQLDVLDLVYTGTEGDAADAESDGEDC